MDPRRDLRQIIPSSASGESRFPTATLMEAAVKPSPFREPPIKGTFTLARLTQVCGCSRGRATQFQSYYFSSCFDDEPSELKPVASGDVATG